MFAATQAYLADALRRLAEMQAGAEPPAGVTREQHIADLEENILIYQRALQKLRRTGDL